MISACPLSSRPDRRAVTLMEILLVLCLLVILAAISWPALERPMANQRLRAAANAVRAEWARARVKAMSSGQTVLFRYAVGGDRYSIQFSADAPLSPDLMTASQWDYAAGMQNEPAATEGSQLKLPEGVTFACGETADDTLAGSVGSEADLWGGEDTAWEDAACSEPILFYPDGSTSDARLLLKNEHNCYVDVSLRGVTGVATLGDVYSAEVAGEELLP